MAQFGIGQNIASIILFIACKSCKASRKAWARFKTFMVSCTVFTSCSLDSFVAWQALTTNVLYRLGSTASRVAWKRNGFNSLVRFLAALQYKSPSTLLSILGTRFNRQWRDLTSYIYIIRWLTRICWLFKSSESHAWSILRVDTFPHKTWCIECECRRKG